MARHPARADPSAPGVGWGVVPSRVTMHLLKERPAFASARDLARQLGLGHTKVAEVVNLLLFHRALRQGEAGFVVEWEQLARVMGALRLPAIVPARTLDVAALQAGLRDRLRDAGIPHAFGFVTAANALAYFEPHPDACILVEKEDVRRATELLEKPATARSSKAPERAGLSRPRLLLFADRLDRLDLAETKAGTVTSLHQTYVDLLHYPLAGAHAEVLRKAVEKRWARDHPGDASTSARRR